MGDAKCPLFQLCFDCTSWKDLLLKYSSMAHFTGNDKHSGIARVSWILLKVRNSSPPNQTKHHIRQPTSLMSCLFSRLCIFYVSFSICPIRCPHVPVLSLSLFLLVSYLSSTVCGTRIKMSKVLCLQTSE